MFQAVMEDKNENDKERDAKTCPRGVVYIPLTRPGGAVRSGLAR